MKRNGLTLVELMVGLLIFSILGLAYYQMTSSLNRETQFSMETFQSQLLALKVGEFINQDSMTNPIAPENYNGLSGDIVDGATPMFQRIYNRSGKSSFTSGVGAIEQDSDEFYSQLKKYGIKVETKTDVDEYYSVDCYVNWSANVGKGQNNISRFFPKVHQARNVVLEKFFSDADLDKFCSRFFFLKDPPLETAATSGNLATIRALGTVFYSSMKFLTDENFEKDIEEVENLKQELAGGVTGTDKIEVLKKIASMNYEMAKSAYLVMAISEAPFQIVKAGFNSSGIGQIYNENFLLREGFNSYEKLCSVFNKNLWESRKAYLQLLDRQCFDLIGSRRQYLYLLKTINLSRIISICDIGDSSGSSKFKNLNLLKKLRDDFKGRNSHIERLLEQEISFNGDPQRLVEKFPYLQSVNDIVGQGKGAASNLAFIKNYVN